MAKKRNCHGSRKIAPKHFRNLVAGGALDKFQDPASSEYVGEEGGTEGWSGHGWRVQFYQQEGKT
jgi:hypothetical protein